MFIIAAMTLCLASQATAHPPDRSKIAASLEDKAEVIAVINSVFAALEAGDISAIRANLRPAGTVTSVIERDDGTQKIVNGSWEAYLEGVSPSAARVEERLIDPTVAIDGSIAMVWGRYTTSIGGELRHCGYDHFDLVRDAEKWKIQNITWTVRFTGCVKYPN